MQHDLTRPKFLPSFFDALRVTAEKEGLRSVFPTGILVSLVVGGATAYFIPLEFWNNARWDVSTTVYSGLLTFNGLIMALSWSAFSRIYEIIGSPKFGTYLRSKKLLNHYIVYVGFVHAAQILAIILSALGLFTLILDIGNVWLDRSILALMIASTAYAIYRASSTIGVMHDLIWQKSVFDDHQNDGSGQVVPLGRANDH